MKQFLPSAVQNTISDVSDLILADNGSSDNSVAWVKENFPEVKIIEFNQNFGFAEGYNRAINITRYPYTILLNSDVEVPVGWWQPILEFLEENPNVGAVQPKIKSFHNKEYFEYAGAAGGFLDSLGYPYCRGRIFDIIQKDKGQFDPQPADVCWASGACLGVRTDVYMECGGLDPLFFAHMEEIDLCCRILAHGYRVCAISSSEIFHVGGGSLSQGNPKKTYLNFRNNLLLLYKNLPKKIRDRKLILRRMMDSLAFFMFIAKFDFQNALAILKAHRDFRKMKSRYKDFPEPPENFKFPGSHRNIVLDRYIFNKKI